MKNCPLCNHEETSEYYSCEKTYRLCPRCHLVFMEPEFHLSLKEESNRYHHHQNNPEDEGYRNFLNRLAIPLSATLTAGDRGLDFGCGPGPVLASILEEYGFPMDLYDPVFHDDKTVFRNKYDFITSSEVIEHLHYPGMELDRLWGMLKVEGTLALMTAFRSADTDFNSWYYKNDPTHVCFFSEKTFRYLADRWNADMNIPSRNVVLLKKEDWS